MNRIEKGFPTHVLVISLICISMLSCQEKKEIVLEPVPFTAVKLTDTFWSAKIKTNREVTIPIAIQQCYNTGRVDNFKIAGGLMEGAYQTQMPFDDTDIYKLIEAASYSLQNIPDPKLEARLDTLIGYIRLAQEPDGYIYTSRTIDPLHPHEWADSTRWTGDAKGYAGSHELYNCGHLFESATAHYAATGKRSFLDIAIKTADLLVKDFGPGKLEFGPGHQVVEMGLVKMYNTTGKKEYLDLAKFFLDARGPGGEEYSQAHEKVIDQREPVGHAVRATYMYSAMADIASMYKDTTYSYALKAIWNDLIGKKFYVTGGIGSGGGNEGFDPAYVLPNMAAYCETCASVGNIYWNERMFLLDGTAKYVDVLERTLYNSFLSGVSLSGDRFFYPNVLESIGQHERGRWFGTACCPPNVARTLPSVPGYIYAKYEQGIFVNLYIANEASIDTKFGNIKLIQETEYPWNGKIDISVNPSEIRKFKLHFRIPGWANNEVVHSDLYKFDDGKKPVVEILLNEETAEYEMTDGYAVINRKWNPGDKVSIRLEMEPRVIAAHDSVAADQGKVAIQRGPIVYTTEWPDVADGKVLSLIFSKEQEFKSEFKPDLLGGVMVVKGTGSAVQAKEGGGLTYGDPQEINMIPYYSWNNRGAGEMMVWLPVNEANVRPLPLPTIASTSKVSGSRNNKTIVAVNDQLLPENSIDHTWPFYHWWPQNDSWQWIEYEFDGNKTISSSEVYWFDDQPFGGCTVPDEWLLEYKKGEKWFAIKTDYPVVKDGWSKCSFASVEASAIRLKVKLSKTLSGGVHEWVVN